MTVEDAKEARVIGAFEDKYGKNIKVYSIGEFLKKFVEDHMLLIHQN